MVDVTDTSIMLYLQLVIICTIVFIAIVCQRWFKKSHNKVSKIPGPQCTDKVKGHLDEIESCGSLHQFLGKFHKQYGPILSFWMGNRMYVSIASSELFQEHAEHFDRPVEAFEFVIPLVGKSSIQLANGEDGRRRHAAYSKAFNTLAFKRFYAIFSKIGKELVENWSELPKGEYILLQEHSHVVALRSILSYMFGEEFDDQKLMTELKAAYDYCWLETERFAVGDFPLPESARQAEFDARKTVLYDLIKKAVFNQRQLSGSTPGDEKLPLHEVLALGLPDQESVSDLLTLFIGGFHTTAMLLTWCIYFLATHQDVQSKAREEVLDVLESSDQVSFEMANQLKYMHQVLKETLRMSLIGPIAARVSHSEIILGGYKVPAEVPVIQALGLSFFDESHFPQPDKFNPDRFSFENEEKLSPFSFEPFGFAGKRKCPGYNFSIAEAKVILAILLRAFQIDLAYNQVAEPAFGFVTKIKNDIWLSVTSIS